MNKPTLEQLDNHRKEGFRPGVVLCVVFDQKILLVYKKAHKLWQLPQGRIKNKEDPRDALKRTTAEELGEDFAEKIDYDDAEYINIDQMEFKPGRHKVETLADDGGKEVDMIGKVYYAVGLPSSTDELDVSKTQFDQHHWMSFKEANFLAERIYQRGKKRITVKILNDMYEQGLIA